MIRIILILNNNQKPVAVDDLRIIRVCKTWSELCSSTPSPALAVFPCCTSTQLIEDTVCNLLNTLDDNGSICCNKYGKANQEASPFFKV